MKRLVVALVVLALGGPAVAQAAGTPSRDARAWKKATNDCLRYSGCHGLRLDWKLDYAQRRCTIYKFRFNGSVSGKHTAGYAICG